MADKELIARVCHAYATSAQWSNANPVLMGGEMGVESDTLKYKIGDGITKWSNLSYASGIIVDEEFSSTSINPVQNKAIYNALLGKVGTDIFSGFALIGATAPITWRQGSQVVGSLTASNYTGTALRATQDGDGNVITETYAKKADVSGVVKSVNGTKPDSNGNVTIAVSSGGGVSTSESNTWTAQQSFDLALLGVEKYKTTYANGNSVKPSSVTAVYNATGSFTLDLTNFSSLLSIGQSLVFTAYIKANADYPLTITNGGTLKYTGNSSDLAITSAGLLLNIFITLDNSGNKTSIVQASKLS